MMEITKIGVGDLVLATGRELGEWWYGHVVGIESPEVTIEAVERVKARSCKCCHDRVVVDPPERFTTIAANVKLAVGPSRYGAIFDRRDGEAAAVVAERQQIQLPPRPVLDTEVAEWAAYYAATEPVVGSVTRPTFYAWQAGDRLPGLSSEDSRYAYIASRHQAGEPVAFDSETGLIGKAGNRALAAGIAVWD